MKKEAKQTPLPPLPSPTADQDSAGDDRISALDDDLCKFILSLAHLNVRELVRTSVLSKRWRGLWKRLPVLDFFGWPEFKSAGEVQQYITIINNVLEQRAGVTSEACIDEVKIPLLMNEYSIYGLRPQRQRGRLGTSLIALVKAAAQAKAEQLLMPAMEAAEAWIRYAMHHQVKSFQFNLCLLPLKNKTPVMDLDELLSSSPKLECMRMGLSNIEVQLPRTAVFTSLKDLTLEFVELAAGSGHLSHLLSSVCCPSLQKLRMMHVNLCGAGTKELVLDTGELLELSMEAVEGMELLELRTPKLLYLEIDDCYHESLRVSAPRLEDLTYVRNRAFIHGPLPRVWRLKIDLPIHKEEDDDNDGDANSSSISLLNRCSGDANSSSISLMKRCSSSVTCLLVHPLSVPWGDERQVDLIKDKIPQLPNVTSLLVSIAHTCQRHSFGDGVAGLLTRLKNVKYLSLDASDIYPIPMADDDVDSAFTCNHPDHWESSNISLANLHKADFRGMTGTACELRFLRFVLANTTYLQSVTVSFNLDFIEEELHDTRMHYFLHTLLGDGMWTACENEDQDFDKLYNCCKFSKLYKWTPSP